MMHHSNRAGINLNELNDVDMTSRLVVTFVTNAIKSVDIAAPLTCGRRDSVPCAEHNSEHWYDQELRSGSE